MPWATERNRRHTANAFPLAVIMKPILMISSLILFSCSGTQDEKHQSISKMFSESEILQELDLAFDGIPSAYFPKGQPEDIKYNFFFDLEHGYFETAGTKIHLYSDSTRWAIVFEKNGYQNRKGSAEIELSYVGNCINYPVDKYPERNYITNTSSITLIDQNEFSEIEEKADEGPEAFELIDKNVKKIKVRDITIPFDNDYKNYEKVGIKFNKDENPKRLIGFADLIRYLNEINPTVISATEQDIRQHIPKDLPVVMTITQFHYSSAYDKSKRPSTQEIYKLIAKVLVTKDSLNWKPTEKPNNHWTNWNSGNL